MGVTVAEDFASVPLKPKSALKNRAATEFFENQIKGTVGQKDLFEYSEKIEGDEAINVRAFRKYAYGGVGTFHTYVTQFPFRGHDSQVIEDVPPNKQAVLSRIATPVTAPEELMHPDLTAEIMKQNPLVFGMYQAKI